MNNNQSDTSFIHHHDHKTHAARARKLSLSNRYTCKKYKICARKILAIIVLFRCLFCCVAWRVFVFRETSEKRKLKVLFM